MTDLAKLIERVEKATGPDRDLDAILYVALCGADASEEPSEFGLTFAPELTASIDAALGLVERVLPGTLWATGSMEEGPFCQLVVPNGRGDYIGGDVRANAATPPLAILLALLRALSARSP